MNKCFCEYHNGQGNDNGILCERNGTFQKALLCGENKSCSGPSTEEDAVNGTIGLCKQGRKYHLSVLTNAFLDYWNYTDKFIKIISITTFVKLQLP